jgi:hypothetical protein
MLKIISAAATGIIAAGSIGYSYVQKAQEHVATLERDNKTLTAQVVREDIAIDKAIAALQAARSKPAAAVSAEGRGDNP